MCAAATRATQVNRTLLLIPGGLAARHTRKPCPKKVIRHAVLDTEFSLGSNCWADTRWLSLVIPRNNGLRAQRLQFAFGSRGRVPRLQFASRSHHLRFGWTRGGCRPRSASADARRSFPALLDRRRVSERGSLSKVSR